MIKFIKKEAVLTIAAFAAIVSALFVKPDLQYIGYINFKVLGLLFSLMAIVAGLRGLKVFDIIAKRLTEGCNNMRSLIMVLVALCFFSSMLITNDVALLTFVPLAIEVLLIVGGKHYIIYTVIMQTVAANMGSMLTPVGNPQNLYLADFYDMSAGEFFSASAPVCFISGVLIFVTLMPIKNEKIEAKTNVNSALDKRLTIMYALLGALALMSVFDVLPYLYIVLTVLTLALVLIFDRRAIKRVDWFLLLTFVMFFIFVGNAARIDAVRSTLSTFSNGRELLAGVLVSQIISNVPAAVMLSSFTENGRELLIGVDIGGLGTPVASLASLISYRLYAERKDSDKCKYMLYFLCINFALLAILLLIVFCLKLY